MSESTDARTHAPAIADEGLTQPGRPRLYEPQRPALDRIADEARDMRESFGRSRSDFNARVCDMLAAAGMPPTGALVLQVGRWGTSADVQADVRAWFASLAKEKEDYEMHIPAPARRRARELIEQLFELANQSSQMRLEERLAPIQEELTKALAHSEGLMERVTQVQSQMHEERAGHAKAANEAQASMEAARLRFEDAQALAAKLAQDLQEEREHVQEHQVQIRTLHASLAARERDHERELAAVRHDLAQAQTQAAEQLLLAQQNAEKDRRTLMLKMDEERTQHNELVKTLTADSMQARQRTENLLTEVSELTLQKSRLAAEADAGRQALAALKAPEHRAAELAKLIRGLKNAGLLGLAGTPHKSEVPAPDGAVGAKQTAKVEKELAQARQQEAQRTAGESLERGSALLQGWVGGPADDLDLAIELLASAVKPLA
jgi:hypothetical protein